MEMVGSMPSGISPNLLLICQQVQDTLKYADEGGSEEIYLEPYSLIDFSKICDTTAPTDIKRPQSTVLKLMNAFVRA